MDGPQYGKVPLGSLRWSVFGGGVCVCVCVRWVAFPRRDCIPGAPTCIVHSCPFVNYFPEGRFWDGLSCGASVESLARDLLLNRTFGEHCAMPQLVVEVSWFEIFRIAMWWLSLFVGFCMGQSYGAARRPVVVAAEKASSEVPKDKSDSGSSANFGGKVPFGEDGPRATTSSGSDAPFGKAVPPEGPSSSSGTRVPGGASIPSEIYMTSSGKVLHSYSGCRHLLTKDGGPKPDLSKMRWCLVCSEHCNPRSKSD